MLNRPKLCQKYMYVVSGMVTGYPEKVCVGPLAHPLHASDHQCVSGTYALAALLPPPPPPSLHSTLAVSTSCTTTSMFSVELPSLAGLECILPMVAGRACIALPFFCATTLVPWSLTPLLQGFVQ